MRWHELAIEPAPASHVQRIDYFGNAVDQFTILTPYDELRVVGRSVVEVIAAEPPIDADAGAPWEAVRDELFYKRGAPYADASEFSYPSPYAATAPELAAFARDSFAPERPLVAAAVDLMHRIHEEFTFDPGSTTIATPVTRVLADRRGVCQDFAHLQIGCLRSLGLAARYVSGYLLTEPPPGQPRLVGADASHAWLSVWCPRARVGRSRSHQRRPAVASPRHARLGPRLRRRQPAARRRARRPHAHAARRRQRDAGDGRRHVAGRGSLCLTIADPARPTAYDPPSRPTRRNGWRDRQSRLHRGSGKRFSHRGARRARSV